MKTQAEIQAAILKIAQSREITLPDFRHLGTPDQISRARKALRNSGQLIVVGERFEGTAKRTIYSAKVPDEPKPVAKHSKWPCGTPKSAGNAFDWKHPGSLFSRKEQIDARTTWKRGAGIAI